MCHLLEFKKVRSSGTINCRTWVYLLSSCYKSRNMVKKIACWSRPGTKLTNKALLWQQVSHCHCSKSYPTWQDQAHKCKISLYKGSWKEFTCQVALFSTDVQLANIMTKALPKSRLEFLRLKLGMSKANLKEEC